MGSIFGIQRPQISAFTFEYIGVCRSKTNQMAMFQSSWSENGIFNLIGAHIILVNFSEKLQCFILARV